MNRLASVTQYSSPIRRRARSLRRVLGASVAQGLYPTAPIVPAYWWDGHPNFGDALTPWLLPRYGLLPVHTAPERAKLVGVGSILEQMPEDFAGVIWGSGLLRGARCRFPGARVLALRGNLTRQQLGLSVTPALGDPGILVSRHLARRAVRWRLGIVPHGVHANDPHVARLAARSPGDVRIVNVARTPGRVISEIAACEAIVSTSLHGLVVADSFGIPAAWTVLSPGLWGEDFKFRDYESVMTPGTTRRVTVDSHTTHRDLLAAATSADEECTQRSMSELEASIAEIHAVEGFPLSAWRRR